ncbi:MAG: protein-L-isoaspartate O-methyltransferase [Steroidobacteraceae bacterium]
MSLARTQMTYQQVRAWSVLPPEVLEIFERLPREDFVPSGWQGAAYGDLAVPLADHQHMLTPTVVGRILQAVTVQHTDSVLEVGTGSGYLTACLGLLARQVHSLEIRPELARQARTHLHAAGIGNASVEDADVFHWQPVAPAYDVIVVTGSLPVYDNRFEALLGPGGRLFVVSGDAPVMEARLIRKDAKQLRDVHSLFETVIDPLDHTAAVDRFEF